jgi:hypothetical protein
MQALVFALLICGLLAISMTVISKLRFARIKKFRHGEGSEEFSSKLVGIAVPSLIQSAVFEFLRKRIRDTEFPVRPEDDLAWVYGMVEEDVYDASCKIAAGCGKILPERSDKNVRSIRTVSDLVWHVAGRPDAK